MRRTQSLLAVGMEEGAASQGMQGAKRSWKRQGVGSPLGPPAPSLNRMQCVQALIVTL